MALAIQVFASGSSANASLILFLLLDYPKGQTLLYEFFGPTVQGVNVTLQDAVLEFDTIITTKNIGNHVGIVSAIGFVLILFDCH